MLEAIGAILPLSVAVALSPVPIIAVILMLVSAKARVNGPMFIVGWVVGLAVIGVIVLAAAGPADASDDGDPATWVAVVELVLGALLLLVAVKQWRGRPRDGEVPSMPKWMGAIDGFTPVKATGAGALLSGLNPKNLLCAVAAGTAIAQLEIDGAEQAVAYAVFALIGTIGVAIPVVVYFALGDRAPAMLQRLQTWMAQNNAVIMSVLMLVIGVKVLGDGLGKL